MTDTDVWFDSDPVRTEPATTIDLSDVPLDPRLAALRDGTAPPAEQHARRRRIAILEQEVRDYAAGLDQFDALIAHVEQCPGVSVDIIGVAVSHLVERKGRVLRAYTQTTAALDTLRKSLS